jgi:small subunit ribosomal protein S2
MKELLESGVHFGHQTRRWNPKMREYIFGERNGIHIIDLQKTLKLFKEAARYVSEMSEQGKNILFVGTKRQAQEAIAEEAQRCHMYYVNNRWLGGLLTNWTTVQKSIARLKELDRLATEEQYEGRSKKEISRLERERKHLHQNLAGIKDMPALPDVMVVIDSNKEEIAVREARKLNIPVIAVVDTNSDPDVVDYVIPGNDDALRAIRLFASKVSDAVIEGLQMATEPQFAEQPTEEMAAGDAGSAEGHMTGVGESARYSSGAAYEETGSGIESGTDAFGEDFVGYSEAAAEPEPKPEAEATGEPEAAAEPKPEAEAAGVSSEAAAEAKPE